MFRLVMAGLAMFLLSGTQARAAERCETMTIEATAYAATSNPLGQYVGTALLTFGGHSYKADVVLNPQGLPKFSEDGTIHLELLNQFSSPELASTFECYDHVIFAPVSGDPTLYRINNRVAILNGTGVFSEAFGKLIAHGEANMAQGRVSVVANGRICYLME